jgi:hypothetical protein
LLTVAKQRRHRNTEELAEQVQQRRLDPGNDIVDAQVDLVRLAQDRRLRLGGDLVNGGLMRRRPAPPSTRRTLFSVALYRPSCVPITSGRMRSRVPRIASLPGISAMPVRLALSFSTTMFRVKNGPCAPARFSNMLSRPATGMTCISTIAGVSAAIGVVSR